ncbi:hypothetical protein BDY21DRAFT_303412 [Lineolata rhizophorae]|uniref:Phosphatidate phosphatase APP1 catalytic domain-containing protein n=1 Tax=Lineolata rhizophorae TaxID=578093 RepID=A0A6A6P0W8_9PEZI|nr:hypothetical protein BDY21DRAFT_303412 [Lineolata rhizophorae]
MFAATMRSGAARFAAALSAFAALAGASPAPTAVPDPASVPDPVVTPAYIEYLPTKTRPQRRDIIDALGSAAESVLGSLPSYVVSGVQEWGLNLPTGDAVQSSLSVSDDDLDALPTQVMNIPPYANWTDQGWNVRFHGNVYKQPNLSEDRLNELADIFLPDVDAEDLPPDQAEQARNLTGAIFVVQQDDENVTMHIEPAPSAGSSGEEGGGGATTPEGGYQNITLPYETTELGDFDAFVPIELNGLTPGNETDEIQRLNVYAQGATLGNATAYLVPPTGLTIISDIDDILRVTKIYDPEEGLLNTFARPFRPWMNMPDIYANWSRSLDNAHFHYLTTTPEQGTRLYMDFIYKTYPGGSFDTRPLNFSDVSATLSIRKYLLDRVLDTFPQRKFVLVGDTTNSDVMSDYPQLAQERPDQVQCILLRNTSATDDSNHFPYDTSDFENLNNQSYMFFRTPDDLMGLDIEGGNCLNASVRQNVTFGYQNLPFGEDAAVTVFPNAFFSVMAAALAMTWLLV